MKHLIIFLLCIISSYSMAGGDTWSRQSSKTAQTPLRQNVNGATYSITNLSNVVMTNGATLNAPTTFYVYNSATQAIAHNSNVLINYDAENFDTNNVFDLAANSFTPNHDGKWLLIQSAFLGDVTVVNTIFMSIIYTNGVALNRLSITALSLVDWHISAGGSAILNLTTNDEVKVYLYQYNASGLTQKTLAGIGYNYFMGVYLGE